MINFRQAFLPYALTNLGDGWFLPVNRDYKPLGFPDIRVDYHAATSKVRIKGLTPARATRIGLTIIGENYYLYTDVTNPARSTAHWRRYESILNKLMTLTVIHAVPSYYDAA